MSPFASALIMGDVEALPEPPPENPPPPPGDPCAGACGITDAFSRSISTGTTWGNSDAGYIWNAGALSPIASVSGGKGILDVPGSGGVANSAFQDLVFPDRTTFDCLISGITWTFNNALSGTSYRQAEVRFIVDGPGGFDVQLWWNWDRFTGDGCSWNINGGTQTALPAGFFNSPFNIRISADGAGNAMARIWAASDPEPGTWLTTSTTSGAVINGLEPYNQITRVGTDGANNTGHAVLSIDSIDIDGVTNCTHPQFDDFQRAASGTWGVASSGVPWQHYVDTFIVTNFGITNDLGYWGHTNTRTYFGAYQDYGPDAAPWSAGAFTLTTRFMFSYLSVNQDAFYIIIQQQGSATQYIELRLFHNNVAGVGATGSVDVLNGVGSTGSTAKTDWAANVWYNIKWEWLKGSYQRAKVWPDGTAEPGTWTVSVADAGGVDFTGDSTEISINSNQVAVPSSEFGNLGPINITYPGSPCFPRLGLFDTFNNRSVSPGWGTPSSYPGFSWSVIGDTGSSPATNVDGNIGYLRSATFASHAYFSQSGVWSAGPHQMTAQFACNNWSSDPAVSPFTGNVTFGDYVYTLQLFGTTGKYSLAGWNANYSGSLGFNFVNNTLYNLRWDLYKETAGHIKVKIWPVGTAEPGAWTIDVNDGAGAVFGPDIELVGYKGNAVNNICTFNDIDFT